MASPIRNSATTSKHIVVDWVASTSLNNGGATATSYNLMWDAGSSGVSWFNLIGADSQGPFTGIQFIASTGIIMGQDYQFKVRAQNMWGWGPFSDPSTIRASEPPATMIAPVTSIDSATGGLRISWTQPNNMGNTITKYLIEIQNKLQSSWYSTSSCNGAN